MADFREQLSLDASGFIEGLTNASKATSAFGAQAAAGLSDLTKRFADMGDRLNKLTDQENTAATAAQRFQQALAGVSVPDALHRGMQGLVNAFDEAKAGLLEFAKAFTVLAGPTTALEALAMQAGKAAEQIGFLTVQTGISAEALQGWDVLMRRNGGSAQDLAMAMRSLSTQLVEARDPTSQAAQGFKDLFGSAWKDVVRQEPQQVLLAIADALSKTNNGVDKNTIGVQMLGRTYLQTIKSLNDGTDAYFAASAASKRFGELTEEQLAILQKMDDSFDDLKTALDRTNQQIGANLAPSVLVLNQNFLTLMGTMKDIATGPGGFGIMEKVIKTTSYALATLDGYVKLVGISFGGMGAIMATVWDAAVGNIPVLSLKARMGEISAAIKADIKDTMRQVDEAFDHIANNRPYEMQGPPKPPLQKRELVAHKTNEAVEGIKAEEDALKAADAEADRAYQLQKSRNAGQVADAKLNLAVREIDEEHYLIEIERLKEADAQLEVARDEQKLANYRAYLTKRRGLEFKDAADRKHFEAQAAMETTKRETAVAVASNKRTAQELDSTSTLTLAQIKADEDTIVSYRHSLEQRELAWLKYKQALLSGRAEVAALDVQVAEQANATFDEQLGRRLLAIEAARKAELNSAKTTAEEITAINERAQLAIAKAVQDTATKKAQASANAAKMDLDAAEANLESYEVLAQKRLAILDAEYARDVAAFKGSLEEKRALNERYQALRAQQERRAQDGLLEGMREGLHKYVTDTESMWNIGVDMARQAASEMKTTFNELFFDTMTGKLHSLQDVFKSVFTSIQKIVANALSAMATQAVMKQFNDAINPAAGTGAGAGAGAGMVARMFGPASEAPGADLLDSMKETLSGWGHSAMNGIRGMTGEQETNALGMNQEQMGQQIVLGTKAQVEAAEGLDQSGEGLTAAGGDLTDAGKQVDAAGMAGKLAATATSIAATTSGSTLASAAAALTAAAAALQAAAAALGGGSAAGGGAGGIAGLFGGNSADAGVSDSGSWSSSSGGLSSFFGSFGGAGFGAASQGGSEFGSANMWTTSGIDPTLLASTGGYIKPRYFAAGGPVRSNGDSVPAMLTPGEFVVSKTGVEALQRANEGLTPGGKPGSGPPITITMNISTPDAASFKRSQGQIMADLYARTATAGKRNL